MSHEDEISELILYITNLRGTFNRKLDDHLFIMEQQNERIEEQMNVIYEQRQIVDELAWQIRDLRDSVRKVSEQKSAACACNCQDENHRSRHPQISERKLVATTINIRKQHKIIDEQQDDGIYENIDVPPTLPTTTPPPKPAERTNIQTNNLNSPEYTDVQKRQKEPVVLENEVATKRTTRYVKPSTSINNNTCTTTTTAATSTPRTRSIYEALERLKIGNLKERDSLLDEDDDDIMFRIKNFKRFPSNSQRGSSKVVCSLISDIDEDYFPRENEIKEENVLHLSTTSSTRSSNNFRRNDITTTDSASKRMAIS